MTFKGAPITLVNLQKVFYDFLKIQLAFGRQYVSKTEVFDVMTQVTKGDETCELLNVSLIVILPNLMAIKSSLGSAYATLVTILCIGLFSCLIPCSIGH